MGKTEVETLNLKSKLSGILANAKKETESFKIELNGF